MLRLYNSLTKKKELFISIRPKEVSLYVCGITPYDTTHLGHAFTYISFDVLVRVLKHEGLKINYTQNVTDINDRDNDILKRAKEQNMSWNKLADFWTEKFLKDMSLFNWIKPTNYLKASGNITSMIRIIELLLNKKLAYRVGSSVYFDISKKKDFGKLSRLNKTQMLKIAKDFDEDVENPDKKNPLDITLWRATDESQPAHIPSFESPFARPPATSSSQSDTKQAGVAGEVGRGLGRPGWHIECSSMAISTLREQIDIHGGGIDLLYPHHEAEIAQSEGATGKIPFSKFWMHVGQVSYQGEKMSKSLGNLVMVSDLLRKYSANVIRWYLISHHYRQSFEFFEKDLEESKIEFSKISEYINIQESNHECDEDIFNKFINALEDDLNTPLAFKIMSHIVKNKGSVLTLRKCFFLLGFLV